MRRTVCRGCESKQLEAFLNLGDMPLAGGFLASKADISKENVYPLPVHVCKDCGLVQILEVIDPEILFQDYSFSSSTIAPLVQHFKSYADWIKVNFNPKTVLEFGCNDGVLIDPLNKLGIRAAGIDVSKNISELAQSKGLDVSAGYFNVESALQLRERLGEIDLVTGSNAFAHNDQPGKILEAAKTVLSKDGLLCLEVMYAGDLIEQYQWDTLYHEHLTFYSLTTISKLLSRYGFKVIRAERIPMHGGSLRLAASVSSNATQHPSVAELFNYEEKNALAKPETWQAWGSHIARKIEVVDKTLSRLSKNACIWGYGAAGKSTLWVNACKMNYLDKMVDASPLRAGKLMPGTHTPIVFPEELKANPPDYIFITAWNYAEHIKSKESWFNGIWITPLPELRFF